MIQDELFVKMFVLLSPISLSLPLAPAKMTSKTIIQISILIGENVKSSESIENFAQKIARQHNDKQCSTKTV